ncbi:hypothetical protein CRE_06122 [Caenorhabditis remanei]|uniref:F-box domain-containing protein n=1 Tax=Caenorhabditis remanei TaxID=31234 RepID=E3NEF1_CAERE|nr:hypothetical protein CRE_06122 [Caenorhabditis remanei]
MEHTFPLLQLPENAIIIVLENLRLGQLFELSLLSSKCKNLVVSLSLRVRVAYITISRKISLIVYTDTSVLVLHFYNNLNDQNVALPADITLPADAFLSLEKQIIQSTTFNFSDWLNYIRTVFCFKKPPSVYFREGCERFEVQYLKEAIGNVDVLYVANEVTGVYNKEVLKRFIAPNSMSLGRNLFDETCEVQKFFIQNFERVEFNDVYSLDDMLLLNSEKVKFYRPTTQKQINQFLHHWIRGSNRRLQRMSLSIGDTDLVRREVLLKGINFVDVAEEEQLEICRNHGIDSNNLVQIRRKDGTPAVIAVNERRPFLNVHFVVLY